MTVQGSMLQTWLRELEVGIARQQEQAKIVRRLLRLTDNPVRTRKAVRRAKPKRRVSKRGKAVAPEPEKPHREITRAAVKATSSVRDAQHRLAEDQALCGLATAPDGIRMIELAERAREYGWHSASLTPGTVMRGICKRLQKKGLARMTTLGVYRATDDGLKRAKGMTAASLTLQQAMALRGQQQRTAEGV